MLEKLLDLLYQVDVSFNANDFDKLFGQDGPYLWVMFKQSGCRLVLLWGGVLNQKQRAILVNYLEERQRQQAVQITPNLVTFNVALTIQVGVTVRAISENAARELVKLYVVARDSATPEQRLDEGFIVDSIELTESYAVLCDDLPFEESE